MLEGEAERIENEPSDEPFEPDPHKEDDYYEEEEDEEDDKCMDDEDRLL